MTHPSRPSIDRVALIACALFGLLPTIARAQTIDTVVLEGDAVPDVVGQVFDAFGPPSINDASEIAFEATFDSGGGQGIFLHTPTGFDAIALRGQTAPDTGGGTFFGFFDPAINASGEVAFVATVVGGTGPPQGVFLYSSGTISALSLVFETALGSGGGFFGGYQSPLGLTDAGEAIVTTSVSAGTFSVALYGFTTTASRIIVFGGQSAPAPLMGTYFGLGTPSVSGGGEVALPAFLLVPGFTTAIIHIDPAGAGSVVAMTGGLAPNTGGTFSNFPLTAPPINDSGDVATQSFLTGGTVANALFVFKAAGGAPAMLPGQTAPGTAGLESYGQPTVNPTIDGAGRVGFRNDFVGATNRQGLFIDGGGPDWPIAIDGDVAPDVPESFFDAFPNPPALSPSGVIAFNATTEGASALNGIWTVPEPASSVMICAGTALLASLARRRPTTR